MNFETSSIFSIPKQSRRSPSARECGGFELYKGVRGLFL